MSDHDHPGWCDYCRAVHPEGLDVAHCFKGQHCTTTDEVCCIDATHDDHRAVCCICGMAILKTGDHSGR